MKINYNISAMIANSSLSTNDSELSKSIEKLSSGLKINHAKDNASGLAMAKRMNAQIKSLDIANQNSNDGISVIEIAEGALSEIEDMVQRMNELATKACNGTLSDADREIINEEITQLKDEVQRVADTTMYNGETLLNGDFDVKGYTSDAAIKVSTYSDEVRSGEYTITNLNITKNADGEYELSGTPSFDANFPDNPVVELNGDALTITGSNNFSMELQIKDTVNATELKIDVTGLGAMGLQIGTNEGQQLDVRISTISLRTLGLENLDVSTLENAQEFLSQMPTTLEYVNEARSRIGAYQNRLEHTVNTLDISEENMTGAYSRIMDVDMSEEMTNYSTYQVLVQASTSMLAQANERPSSVLQLLQ